MKFRMNVFRLPAPGTAAVTFALALWPCAIWAQLPTIDNFKTCTGKLGPFTSGQHTVVQTAPMNEPPCSIIGGDGFLTYPEATAQKARTIAVEVSACSR
jgi:hypothetical protein